MKKQLITWLVLATIVAYPTIASAVSYEYDKLGRVTQATYDDGSLMRYQYDAMGNMLKASPYTALPTKTVSDVNKQWTVTFSKSVNAAALSSIYVVDAQQKKLDVTVKLGTNDKEVLITAPKNGYKKDVTYTVFVADNMTGKNKEKMERGVVMRFVVK